MTKFEHRLQEAFNFDRREIAILCELLLRGPQTPGELRSRAERMHRFDDLGQVQSTLQRLAQREPPLVKVLPRQPGTKEARYAHLCRAIRRSIVQNDAQCRATDAQTHAPEGTREAAVTHSPPCADRRDASRVWRMKLRPFRTKLRSEAAAGGIPKAIRVSWFSPSRTIRLRRF